MSSETSERFQVWCLSWGESEEDGMVVAGYDPVCETLVSDARTIWVAAWNLENAEEAVEYYAQYVHDKRDGYESSWPLKFRVRLPSGVTEDYEVEREMMPDFRAAKLQVAEGTP